MHISLSRSRHFGVARVSVDEAVFGSAAKNEISIVRAGNDTNKEPIVITIMLYHTVQAADGGMITVTKEDVVRGINDIKSIYKMCDITCKLSQLPKMLHPLTAEDVKTCKKKVEQDSVVKDPFMPHPHYLSGVLSP